MRDVIQLSGYAIEVLSLVWPGSLALLLALVSVIIWRHPRFSVRTDWLPLLLATFPISILVWGSLARHEDPFSLGPSWPLYVIAILLALQLVSTVIVVRLCRERRLLAAVVGACVGWWSLANAYISGMAVTGDWV